MGEALYPSRVTPGKQVAVNVWLAEFMLVRQASKEGKELPRLYWQLPDWERKFKVQLRCANSLLKLYAPAAISAALRSKEGRRVYSLSAPWLEPVLLAEQRKLDIEAERKKDVVPPAPPSEDESLPEARPTFKTGQSAVDKLRGL